MARGIVVRQADVIKAYEKRYRDFGWTVRDDASRIPKDLSDALYRISDYQRVMENVKREVDSDLADTRQRLNNEMNKKEKNERLIAEYQERVDKLTALSSKAADAVDRGRELSSKYKSMAEDLESLTNGFSRDIEEYVDRGSSYLSQVASQVDQIKNITI